MAAQSAGDVVMVLGTLHRAGRTPASIMASVPEAPVTFAAGALAMYSAVVLAIALTQSVRPRLTFAVAFLVPAAIYVSAVVVSGALFAALSAGAIIALSWMAGDIALCALRVPVANLPASALLSLRVATGLGCLGTIILGLGVFNGISTLPVLGLALLICMTWAGVHLRDPRSACKLTQNSLRTLPRLGWFETLLIGLSSSFFAFAALATLTPESILTASDSVRQHLPQAREIWQDHAVLLYPTIESPSASVLGASLNAVAFGFGGITGVRILQMLVAVCCLIAIAGLGMTLGGRLAGIMGAAIFSGMPLFLWIAGHAYPDLLAVLFVCASIQCALLWQGDGNRIWLIVAGLLAGSSLATKQISAVVIVAVAVALAISARPGASISERTQATLLFVLASLIATIPWLARSIILTGTFPLLGTLLGPLVKVPGLAGLSQWLPPAIAVGVSPGTWDEVFSGGVARTLPGIITAPWNLTFQGAFSNWRSVRHGEFGILLLMFLPLVLVNLRSRGTMMVAIATFVSFLGWVFTIQVPRHLLPGLALLAVLVGTSVASAISDRRVSLPYPFGGLVQLAAVAALAMTPLFFLPNTSTAFPITVITGATRPEDYLSRVDPATTALSAATALLPADTRVGYIGQWQGAQSSTEARLVYLGQYSPNPSDSLNNQVGDTPEAIFQSFAKLGLRYFIWDRPDTRPQDIGSLLLSGDFLLRYTSILGGDNGTYLFAIHPEGVTDPTSTQNLLLDPEFASLREAENVWHGSKRDLNDEGALQPRRQNEVFQRVTVQPGTPYLIVLTGSCESTTDQTRVNLEWLDADQTSISATSDLLAPGIRPNATLMWRVSPENAVAAKVGISTAAGSPCRITQVGMYDYNAAQASVEQGSNH